MAAFNVPGIAVAIVKDGKVIHSKGYGLRSLNSKDKTDENTLFAIASNRSQKDLFRPNTVNRCHTTVRLTQQRRQIGQQ
jgi:hypothetical protein